MKSTDLMANYNFFTCHFAISWLKVETNIQRRNETTPWKTIKTLVPKEKSKAELFFCMMMIKCYNDDGIVGRQWLLLPLFLQDKEKETQTRSLRVFMEYTVYVCFKLIKDENICLFVSACISLRTYIWLNEKMHLHNAQRTVGKVDTVFRSDSSSHNWIFYFQSILIDAALKIKTFFLSNSYVTKRNSRKEEIIVK